MCNLYIIYRLKKKCFLQSVFLLVLETTVFNAMERFYEEKEIPMQNIWQCATDGAVAMVGKH